MTVLVTKASDDYWYEFKEINTIEDIIQKINSHCIISPNYYTEDEVESWDGFKAKDIPLLKKAKYEIMIYDDYIE